jgi:ferredoxin
MPNFGFVIDNRKCIGCHACSVACKAENQVPVGANRTWVKYVEKGEYPDIRRLFSVTRCNHCANPPCVTICPVTALHQRGLDDQQVLAVMQDIPDGADQISGGRQDVQPDQIMIVELVGIFRRPHLGRVNDEHGAGEALRMTPVGRSSEGDEQPARVPPR